MAVAADPANTVQPSETFHPAVVPVGFLHGPLPFSLVVDLNYPI